MIKEELSMNKQFLKFVAIVVALGLFQTLFSIALAKPDLSEPSNNPGSDKVFNEDFVNTSVLPGYQAVSSTGTAYVTVSSSDLVSMIDTSTHTEIGTINMSGTGCYFPWRATMSPDGAYVYVGCYNSGSVAVIETTGNIVVANVSGIPNADDVAFTRDGAYALVGSRWNDQVAIIDTAAYTVTNYINTPDYARSVAAHPFLEVAYVTSGDGTIQVMDTTTFGIVDSISVGGEPWDVAVSPDGHWVFASDRWGAGLHVIDTTSNSVFTTVTGLSDLHGLEVAPDSSKIYVGSSSGIHIIDGSTFTPITTVSGIGLVWEIAGTCDGSELFAGNVSSHVPVIDTDTYSVTTQIPVSGDGTRGTAICPQYVANGVFLNPSSQTNQGAPGEPVAYEATLINATGATDSFDMTLGGNNWGSSLSDSTIGPLDHGESITFTVYVTIPVGTDWYLTDTVVVTATSVTSPSVYIDSAQMTTQAYAPPQISVLPDSLNSTQFVNEIMSQTMAIANGQGVTLTYSLYEFNIGFIPVVAPVPGHGEWLYQDEKGIQVQNSQGETETVYPSAYRWEPDQPSATLNILVYANNPAHPAPNTLIDQALQTLGLGYTAHYNWDWFGFENDLINGTWDMVLVGDDDSTPPPSTLNALNNYVLGGGKLIIHVRNLFSNPSAQLWSSVGFSYYDTVYPPPPPVEWWEPFHPAFNVPEEVPELTAPNNPGYYVFGQHGNALEGFEAIAGYTDDPTVNQTALIIGNEGRTVFKSFLDIQGGADLDGDAKVDAVELWINLISGIQTGFASDVPWLSENPITGTVGTDSAQIVDVYFDSTNLQPGEYYAQLSVLNNDPISPTVSVPVTLTVQPTANMGWVEGYVTDISTGEPLEATVIAFGQPYTITTDSTTGYYKFWLDAGAYTLQVASSGYVSETANINITAQQGVTQDFQLILNVPVLAVSPNFLKSTQLVGETTTQAMTITNEGPAGLSFRFVERDTTPGILALSEYARSDEEIAALLEELVLTPDLNNQGIPTIARYPVAAFSHLQGGTNILAWTAYTDSWQEYQNTLNALAQYTTFNLSETNTTDPGTLATLLVNADVFLIPEQENASYSYLYSLGTTWASVLNDFVLIGGTIVVMDHCFQSPGLLVGAGLMDVNYYSCGADWPLNVLENDHPLVESLPATFIGMSGTGVYTTTNGLNVIGAEYWINNPVVIARNIGSGHVVLMGFDFYQYNNDMAQLLANAVNWVGGDVPWLSTIPISSTVSGYSALPIEVTFDATGLQPGTYTADLIIHSNDPQTPKATVPVTMTVQPTANMGYVTGMVTDAWTGDPLTATIQVVGVFTTTADPEYTVWTQAGEYTLIATAPGYYTETWPVMINAGSQTTLDLALEPYQARLDFAPYPLDATVLEGFTAEYTLVISNTGPAPLLFDLHELSPTLLSTSASPTDLNGKNILYDRTHEENWQGYFSILITDTILAAGANVDYNDTYPIDAAVLEGYDILWINGGYANWSFGELNAVLTWLESGGAVLIQGESTESNVDVASIYNIVYEYGNCNYSQTTTNILAHPVTVNIDELFIEYTCNYLSSPPDSDVVVYDSWDQAHVVVHEEDGGKMIVIADQDFFDWNIGNSDNLAFALNVLSWLADPAYTDVPWFSTSPVTGTVPGYSTMEVTVSFDATNLPVGSYEAVLALEHNDLFLPSPVQIPVNLTVVAPQAGVALTPEELQASGLPGETVVYTLTVTNQGNIPDSFTIDADSTWQADLSATTTPELGPGESFVFTLSVTVPDDAAEGDDDTTMIMVTSNFDSTVTANVQATTTAYLAIQKVYLPIIVR
jgi:YVTN family beta-propeller protein